MNESNLSKTLLLHISRYSLVRLFRNNTGVGYCGQPVTQPNGDVLVKNPRILRAGLCVGSSDNIGWTQIEITPEMVGKKIAVFTAIEFKKEGGRTSTEQVNFINQVLKFGGIAGIARTTLDMDKILSQQPNGK